MSNTLKNCPFCDSQARAYSEENENGKAKFYAACTHCTAALGFLPNCGAGEWAADHLFASEDDAAEAWNKRAQG